MPCWRTSSERSKEMEAVASSRWSTVEFTSDEQILITREFDAPRELVYKAWTTPELVRRWWHANRGEMTTCDIDLRVGGSYRFAMIACEGFEVAFHGEYRELVPNERIVSTEVYEGHAGRRGAEHRDVQRRRRPHSRHAPCRARQQGAPRRPHP